jgi:hypothetical protein
VRSSCDEAINAFSPRRDGFALDYARVECGNLGLLKYSNNRFDCNPPPDCSERYFDGTPFKPVDTSIQQEIDKIIAYLKKHLLNV